ncbi:MAG: hypothetical protein ACJ79X_04885 [Gemmatimonadaceae bacterium]
MLALHVNVERKNYRLQDISAVAVPVMGARLWRTRRSLGNGGQFDKKAFSFQTSALTLRAVS